MQLYTEVPQITAGYPIPGVWEVIQPVARTNEVLNPSFELSTTGYTAGAGTLTRSATKQFHGVYSGQYVPSSATNDGFYYGVIATTASQIRAISCKFWGQPNVPYALTIATTGGVDLVVYPFKGTGRWQWVWLYHVETSSSNRRIYFRKNGSSDVHTFYVDGVQSEVINAGEYVSTYIDGDQKGFLTNQSPPPYGWTGTAHASTSFRSVLTRSGGHVIPFSRFRFLLLAVVGLGLPTPQHVNTEYALLDGGYPNYTRKPISQFSILGNISGDTAFNLRSNRSQLGRLLDRDANGLDQTLALRYRHQDLCSNDNSSAVIIPCKYSGGLDGNTNNNAAEQVNLTFQQYLPSILSEGTAGGTLNANSSVTWAGVLQRSGSGTWSGLGTGTNNITRMVWYQPSTNRLFIGGDFTTVNGVAANRIAYYDPNTGTWNALGTGLNDTPYDICEDAAGNIYVVGLFTSAGGVANTSRIAKWNGSAWSSITPLGAANSYISNIKYAPDNSLITGGAYTSINGVASNYVSKYAIATGVWTTFGAGPPGPVPLNCLVLSFNGSNPIVTSSVAGPAYSVQSWSGSAWSALGSVTAATIETINSMYMGLNGILYVGGQFGTFTSAGIAANSIVQFNGTSWSPVGLGVYSTAGSQFGLVSSIAQFPNGNLFIGGNFDTTGTAKSLSNIATWDGGAWSSRDVSLDLGGGIGDVSVRSDGAIAIVGDGSPSNIAGQTSISVSGTARTYPVIVLKGPSSGSTFAYIIANLTTGRSVFLNLPLASGETCTFDFHPDNLQFTSSVKGNLQSFILPGSNEAEMFLQPGTNVLAVYTPSTTVTATYQYVSAYLSLDDLQ